MMVGESKSKVVVLCDDLLFSSRISAAARSHGTEVRTLRTAQQVVELAKQEAPSCVIVDLGNPELDIGGLVARLKECCAKMPRVVAFGSHVDAAGLHAAREAGCDPVWPKSKFAEAVEGAIVEWV
jgi:CheY-like chemotaxis protein